jgi:Cu(I)/Ag(I) efflux system membrane fusion protein
LNGIIRNDETLREVISSRATGRIEKLYFKETGRPVKKGQPLYDLYSEELITLQKEYLLANEQFETLGKDEKRYTSYLKAAERKLLLYGLTQSQVGKLAQSKKVENTITFLAPTGGTIAEISAVEGQYVEEGAGLYKIDNVSKLWVEADLYPNELPAIKPGDKVNVNISGYESSPIKATITFVSPEYKAGSQITVVRASISNADGKFVPGMQAQVMLTQSSRKALSIPVDAVIRDGKGMHVYVQTDVNAFQPRRVKTGMEDFEQVEIIEGISENEIIAVTGTYLLYSEFKNQNRLPL